MKVLVSLALLLQVCEPKPLVWNPGTLVSSILSASSGGSPGGSHIADLTGRSVDPPDPEDIDLSPEEEEKPGDTTPLLQGLFQKKVEKIVRKISLLSSLVNSASAEPAKPSFSNDTSLNEVDDDGNGKNAKIGGLDLSPGSIGVFLVELVASVVGLTLGAVTQAGYQSPSNSSS